MFQNENTHDQPKKQRASLTHAPLEALCLRFRRKLLFFAAVLKYPLFNLSRGSLQGVAGTPTDCVDPPLESSQAHTETKLSV